MNAIPSFPTAGDDESPLPQLQRARLHELLTARPSDSVLSHALNRVLQDLDQPQEAISAFGSYVASR